MSEHTILLVDDSSTQRMIIEKHLKDWGYKVIQAGNGKECLEIMEVRKPDLILLDVHMPVMDGFETLYAIRKKTGFEDIPVLFLSGQEQDFHKIKGLELGADDYITKPFNPRVLISRIRSLFRRTTRQKEDSGRMEGNLSSVALSELIQNMEQGLKTCTIVLQEMGGVILLKNGEMLHVRQGTFTGIQALTRLILLNRGPFTIKFDELPDDDTASGTSKPLLPMLMGALAKVDEIRSIVSRIPAEKPRVKIPEQVPDYPDIEKFSDLSPIYLVELLALIDGDLIDNIKMLNAASKAGKVKIIA